MSDNIKLYIQRKEHIEIRSKDVLKVKDLVTLVGNDEIIDKIMDIEIVSIAKTQNEYIIVPIIMIIKRIKEEFENISFHVIGDNQVFLKIEKMNKKVNKYFEILKVTIVCSILFLGAALAITHFHADVNMSQAHTDIYELITGEHLERPLLLQISYSLGLGIGMTIFFYQISPRRNKDEPNPLDIELYSYKRNMEEYILDKEKQKL